MFSYLAVPLGLAACNLVPQLSGHQTFAKKLLYAGHLCQEAGLEAGSVDAQKMFALKACWVLFFKKLTLQQMVFTCFYLEWT